MRRLLAVVCVLGQFSVLGFMAAEREYILRYGKTVYLQTAPIDPRDVFRGDFVRLRYELSRVGQKQLKGGLRDKKAGKGLKVYAVLSSQPNEVAQFSHLTDIEPESEAFIRGRLIDRNRAGANVKYGIEKLFVEQGKGKAMEKRLGNRNEMQTPLEVEVALSASGTAVIKGYRWSRLAIKLEVLRKPRRRNRRTNLETAKGPLSPKLRLSLKNVSEAPLILVNPGDNCSFELITASWAWNQYEPVDRSCEKAVIRETDAIVLAPQEVRGFEIDLSTPRWHMRFEGKAAEISRFKGFGSFRLVYRAPLPKEFALGTDGKGVWQGRMVSPVFNTSRPFD